MFAQRLPRSRVAGYRSVDDLILSLELWLLATMEMGEFSAFRRPLLIALPIGFVLVLRFVEEFLAVRALGILCLLAAEPLLDAAFLRYETSRLLVTVFAYLLIVAGLFWVTMPYLLARSNQLECARASLPLAFLARHCVALWLRDSRLRVYAVLAICSGGL